MNKRAKALFAIGIFLIAMLFAMVLLRSHLAFFAMQGDGSQHAGNWEDDPQNWYRAFKEQQPAQVKVIHSKYWRSNHFTEEYIYFFEVEATPDWTDAFLKNRGLMQVPYTSARSFRESEHFDGTPVWFAPEPVSLYDVWDRAGYFGAVWINKSNGHIFLYDSRL